MPRVSVKKRLLSRMRAEIAVRWWMPSRSRSRSVMSAVLSCVRRSGERAGEERLTRLELVPVHGVSHPGIDALVDQCAEGLQGNGRLLGALQRDVGSTSLQPRKTGVPSSDPG